MKKPVVASLVLFALTTISCDDEESYVEVGNKQELVFDVRKTHQSRILMDKAITATNTSEKLRYMQSALLTTGSATITVSNSYNPGENCIPTNESTSSSAQLVSPTRITTAHHNISNSLTNRYAVDFDGNSPTNDGKWIGDEDWADDLEENPLLANRLWQIGLDYWAFNSSAHITSRTFLRKWFGYVDHEGFDESGTPIVSQPFTSNPTSRKDIAFLKVTELATPIQVVSFSEKPIDTSHYSKSGQFKIEQPGLFFNQVESDDYNRNINGTSLSKTINAIERITPLQLLSAPPWFNVGLRPMGENTPVAHVSGATDTPEPKDSNCAQLAICDASGSAQDSKYTKCIRTSLDSIEGSSGGSMMMGLTGYSDSSSSFYRTDFYRMSYGVLNGNLISDESIEDWWNYDSIASTNSGVPTQEHMTSITVGESDYAKWSKRTTTYVSPPLFANLFNPMPDQPSSDGTPVCENIPGTSDCTYSQTKNNSIWGAPETDSPVVKYPINKYNKTPGESGVNSSGETTTTSTATRRFQCNYNRFLEAVFDVNSFRTKAGMAIGFIGTSTDPYPDSESAVATLGVICAPWSTSSWTDNWNWIVKVVRYRWDGSDDARMASAWQPVLRLALPFMLENRIDKPGSESYVRPMSMKTCPPNTMLKGVGLYTRENTLVGINQLICVDTDERIYRAPLEPTAYDGVPSTFFNYKFKNRLFSIEQRIGDPSPSNAEYSEISCDEGFIVGGIEMTKSSASTIQDFRLECTPIPGGSP